MNPKIILREMQNVLAALDDFLSATQSLNLPERAALEKIKIDLEKSLNAKNPAQNLVEQADDILQRLSDQAVESMRTLLPDAGHLREKS